MAKNCSKCKQLKPLTDFNKGKGRFGYRSWCRACERDYQRMDKERNPTRYLEKQHRVNVRRRAAILKGLGGDNPECKCCGEKEHRFLCVDHIKNNGADERRKYGSSIYLEIKRKGFPPDEYQLLCHNCNMAKQFYGICPHKK